MSGTDTTLRRLLTTALYLAVGLLGTLLVVRVLLPLLPAVQTGIYRTVYGLLGPSEATETAILGALLGLGVVAIALPMLLGDYLSDRGANLPALARAVGVMALLLVAFLLASLVGLASWPTALVVAVVLVLAVPLVLYYRDGVRSGGVTAFVGGVPVFVLLVLVVGFGLGWGWGYAVTAREVPESAVGDAPVADVDEVPDVRDDLFAAAACERDADGTRVCRLELRGYDHEVGASRFLARHGVRCPYLNAAGVERDALVTEHEGTHYRVSCQSYGD